LIKTALSCRRFRYDGVDSLNAIGRPMPQRIFAAAVVILLAGCARVESWREAVSREEAAATVYPQNYRAEILSFMRTYLNDPTQVRDAFISEPAIKSIDGFRRYTVCIRYNARKIGGQYAGSRENLVLFRQGRLDRIVDAARDPREGREIREHCKDVALKPFAELEKLTR
jgi:hypothetical protein